MPESSSRPPVPSTPSPGTSASYREKLWPNVWIWIIAAGIAGAGILVFAPISAGRLHGGGSAVCDHRGTADLVHPHHCGDWGFGDGGTCHHRTPLRWFRGGLPGPRGDGERGTRLNGLTYLCIRGWIDPVVKIEITDPADRTPFWLTSAPAGRTGCCTDPETEVPRMNYRSSGE